MLIFVKSVVRGLLISIGYTNNDIAYLLIGWVNERSKTKIKCK